MRNNPALIPSAHGPQPYRDRHTPPAERHSIAVIALDEQMFREMRGALASNQELTEDMDIHGIVLGLEVTSVLTLFLRGLASPLPNTSRIDPRRCYPKRDHTAEL